MKDIGMTEEKKVNNEISEIFIISFAMVTEFCL